MCCGGVYRVVLEATDRYTRLFACFHIKVWGIYLKI